MPGALPNAMARMKWLGQGSQIPGNAPTAIAMDKILGEEVKREDEQAARHLDKQEALISQERTKKDALIAQMQTHAMDNASRNEIAKMIRASDERIQQMQIDAGKYREKLGSSERMQAMKEDHLQRSSERLGNAATAIAPLVVTGQAVQDMLDRYGDAKSIPGVGYEALLTPPLLKKEGNVNRATIQRFANAVSRSEIGLSQTLSEQAQQALSNMANGKFSEEEFKAGWPEILAKTNASINNLHGAYGPEVVNKYNAQGGNLSVIKSKKGSEDKGTPKVRVFNPATGLLE